MLPTPLPLSALLVTAGLLGAIDAVAAARVNKVGVPKESDSEMYPRFW